MENNIDRDMLELEQMRQKMQQYRAELDRQIDVNEDLMMKQVKKNSRIIKSNGMTVLVFALLAIYPILVYSNMYGLTRVLTITSIVILLVDGIYSYWVTHLVKDEELSGGNVSDVLNSMLRVRKITRIGIAIEILLDVVMILWISYETVFGPRFPYFSQSLQTKVICGLILGILLSFVMVYFMYRKHTGVINELIEILEERNR